MMSSPFAVRESQLGARRTILVEGELDISTARHVEDAVRRACAGGCEELVIDLGEVSFIDSSGVRALLNAVNVCAEAYCRLEMAPSRHGAPRAALRALGLERLLPWQQGTPGPGQSPDEQDRAR